MILYIFWYTFYENKGNLVPNLDVLFLNWQPVCHFVLFTDRLLKIAIRHLVCQSFRFDKFFTDKMCVCFNKSKSGALMTFDVTCIWRCTYCDWILTTVSYILIKNKERFNLNVSLLVIFFIVSDINECLLGNMCVNDSSCINTAGSYKCKCNIGFIKNNEGFCEGKILNTNMSIRCVIIRINSFVFITNSKLPLIKFCNLYICDWILLITRTTWCICKKMEK